ncbi:ABC transporter substrate-binding protein [Halalkalibacter alkaliphilus]|uniref:ABC transporter substrate-binding protein n=1 Tax=Halalkalibacter alkaliphilus TaxID=2917993 RepID=A0A9X2CWR7_9BACI|nr:ABC transporter substrate-binding protein [Halalkalibacter alkaliphilus]MCL7749745.1 ABC transporter substrate-binding protein [Halalkalibacter alkaliphilus]
MKAIENSKTIILSFMLVGLIVTMAACGGNEEAGQSDGIGSIDTITFADAGWDSIRIHNAIAKNIIENGFGYNTESMPGSETGSLIGIGNGSLDVYMEIWTGNFYDQYTEAIDNGEIIELAVNFDDTAEGLYVPTYVIEGDAERGIEPLAPGLKSIHDLPEYWEVFQDPEDTSQGRIYGSIPGWAADNVLEAKMINYGLEDTFTYFQPGSDTALNTSLINAYENGEPWVGYYWEPTWIAGMYDITLLEDEPYDEALWNNGYLTEFPSQRLTIAVQNQFPEQAPEVAEFLSNYTTSAEITNELLAHMQETDAENEEVAVFFLQEYEDVWTTWVSEDIVEKVKAGL